MKSYHKFFRMMAGHCMNLHFLIILLSYFAATLAIEVPQGLRPAKAFGETERPIIPPGPTQSENEHNIAPPNVRTPPNLSLRSRMIAALNSRDNEPLPNSKPGEFQTSESNDEGTTTPTVGQKAPVIFQKNGRKNRKNPVTPVAQSQTVNAPVVHKSPIRDPIQPPAGKNYGVNTLLQTNLVDKKGRIIKGANSVPIRVPSSSELRNARTSQATASQVETDAEKIVPIQFGRAERHRRNN